MADHDIPFQEESIPEPNDPPRRAGKVNSLTVAHSIMAGHTLLEDDKGSVFEYEVDLGHWEEITERNLLRYAFEEDPGRSTRERRNNIVADLRVLNHKKNLEWGRVADHEVACRSGIVDVLTYLVRPHRPGDYLENVVLHPFDPEAECRLWLRCLKDYFGTEDDGTIEALQEFFGYVCLSHAHFKRALVLFGEGDTGKSLVAKVLEMIVGKAFTCSLPVDQMDDPRRRAVIVGKRLNIMTELSADSMISDGGFKTLVSTEEPLLIDDKYKPAFTYTPRAKHVIATNNLPTINDRSRATFRRLLIIPFKNVISPDRQDPTLLDRLESEMPGIVRWSAEGARRLIEQGGEFTAAGRSIDYMEQYQREQNPMIGFGAECLVEDVTTAVPLTQIVKAFNRWNGSRIRVRHIGNMVRGVFGNDAVGNWRPKDGAKPNNSVCCLKGYRLTSEAPETLLSSEYEDIPEDHNPGPKGRRNPDEDRDPDDPVEDF